MNCDMARLAIVDAQTLNLTDAERRELDAHVASCTSCTAEAESMRAFWAMLGDYAAPSPRPDALSRLMDSAQSLEARRRTRAGAFGARRAWASAAALLIAWGIGYLTPAIVHELRSPSSSTAVAATTPQFILLLRGSGTSTPTRPLPAESRLVEEYGEWAGQLARDGKLVGAEKLGDDAGQLLGAGVSRPSETDDRVTGFFVIRARDYDEAQRIAGECPHLKYGGRVELRLIDET